MEELQGAWEHVGQEGEETQMWGRREMRAARSKSRGEVGGIRKCRQN